MKTIDFKGRPYIEVHERVKEFHKLHPKGSISSEIISNDNGVVITKSSVYPDSSDTSRVFTGIAYEKEGNSFINKTSYIENCETSSVGRALGFLGIGIDTSIASANEVGNAIKQQESPTKETPKKEPEPNIYNDKMTLSQLIDVKSGLVDSVEGLVVKVEPHKYKTGKVKIDYSITDKIEEIIVSQWVNEPVAKVGDNIIASAIVVKPYNNTMQYTAENIEVKSSEKQEEIPF